MVNFIQCSHSTMIWFHLKSAVVIWNNFYRLFRMVQNITTQLGDYNKNIDLIQKGICNYKKFVINIWKVNWNLNCRKHSCNWKSLYQRWPDLILKTIRYTLGLPLDFYSMEAMTSHKSSTNLTKLKYLIKNSTLLCSKTLSKSNFNRWTNSQKMTL